MKVLCIDVSNPKHPHLLKPEHYVKESEVYTVSGVYLDNDDGFHYYYLAEKNMVPTPSFRTNRFIPIMEDDVVMETLEDVSVENLY
ncbi:MAG: hypothetical protein ACR2KB_00805 [Chitinophagaceae bacterium]